ncbi:hypothetical protein D9M71_501780 [compost metagenome]
MSLPPAGMWRVRGDPRTLSRLDRWFRQTRLIEVRHAGCWCQAFRGTRQRRTYSAIARWASAASAPAGCAAGRRPPPAAALCAGGVRQERPAERVAVAQARAEKGPLAGPGGEIPVAGEALCQDRRAARFGAGEDGRCGRLAGSPGRRQRAGLPRSRRPAGRAARRSRRLDRTPAGTAGMRCSAAGHLPSAPRVEPATPAAAQ